MQIMFVFPQKRPRAFSGNYLECTVDLWWKKRGVPQLFRAR